MRCSQGFSALKTCRRMTTPTVEGAHGPTLDDRYAVRLVQVGGKCVRAAYGAGEFELTSSGGLPDLYSAWLSHRTFSEMRLLPSASANKSQQQKPTAFARFYTPGTH